MNLFYNITNNINIVSLVLAMGITKPWTQLHSAPSTSTQLHPAPSTSTQLHPAPPSFIHLHPAHFNLHLILCNTLNNIWTKILQVIGQFPQI